MGWISEWYELHRRNSALDTLWFQILTLEVTLILLRWAWELQGFRVVRKLVPLVDFGPLDDPSAAKEFPHGLKVNLSFSFGASNPIRVARYGYSPEGGVVLSVTERPLEYSQNQTGLLAALLPSKNLQSLL